MSQWPQFGKCLAETWRTAIKKMTHEMLNDFRHKIKQPVISMALFSELNRFISKKTFKEKIQHLKEFRNKLTPDNRVIFDEMFTIMHSLNQIGRLDSNDIAQFITPYIMWMETDMEILPEKDVAAVTRRATRSVQFLIEHFDMIKK